MAERITDLIEFVFHYIIFPTTQNLNMCKKVLTCLFICKLKNRFIFTDIYLLIFTIHYLLSFDANDILNIWPTIFFFKMRNVRPCKYRVGHNIYYSTHHIPFLIRGTQRYSFRIHLIIIGSSKFEFFKNQKARKKFMSLYKKMCLPQE